MIKTMSLIMTSLAFSALSLSSAAVFADDLSAPGVPAFRPYVSVFGGLSTGAHIKTHWDGGDEIEDFNLNRSWSIGGAAGVKWNDLLRTELELSHSQWSGDYLSTIWQGGAPSNSSAVGTVAATYLLGNVWVDMKSNSAFTPYAGGGVGLAFVNTTGVRWGNSSTWGYVDASQTRLAWQLGAGVKYDISEQLTLDVGYRFKNVDGLQFVNGNGRGNFVSGRLSSHNIEVGLTYNF